MSLKGKIQRIVFLEMKKLLSSGGPSDTLIRRSGETADQILKAIQEDNYRRYQLVKKFTQECR